MIKPAGRIRHFVYMPVPLNLLPSFADGLAAHGIDVVAFQLIGTCKPSRIESPTGNDIQPALVVLVRAEDVAPDFVFPEDFRQVIEDGQS